MHHHMQTISEFTSKHIPQRDQINENDAVKVSLSGSFDSKKVIIESETGCTVQLMLSMDTKDTMRVFRIESALSIKNLSSKELLIQDQNLGNQG